MCDDVQPAIKSSNTEQQQQQEHAHPLKVLGGSDNNHDENELIALCNDDQAQSTRLPVDIDCSTNYNDKEQQHNEDVDHDDGDDDVDNPFDAFGSDSDDDDDDVDIETTTNTTTAANVNVGKIMADAVNHKVKIGTSISSSNPIMESNTTEPIQHLSNNDLQPLPRILSTWPPPLYQGPIQLVSSLPVGGGRGYVATKDIPAGTLVLVESPMMEWPDNQQLLLDEERLSMVSIQHLLQQPNAQQLLHDFEEYHPTKVDVDRCISRMDNTSTTSCNNHIRNMTTAVYDETTNEQIVKMMQQLQEEYLLPFNHWTDTNNNIESENGSQYNNNIAETLVMYANQRNLTCRDGSLLTATDMLRLLLALRYNGLETGVYRHVAMLNHDDFPNCAKFRPTTTMTTPPRPQQQQEQHKHTTTPPINISYSEVRTTRVVYSGETLSISYLSRVLSHATRRRLLWEQHRFDIGPIPNDVNGIRYQMEWIGAGEQSHPSVPSSSLHDHEGDVEEETDEDANSPSSSSVTRRIERTTEQLEIMLTDLMTEEEIEMKNGNGNDEYYETAMALEQSALELYIQSLDKLKNEQHILLIPILVLHIDACAMVLRDPALLGGKNNATIRKGLLSRQVCSCYRLLPLQIMFRGCDHYDLARTHLDLIHGVSELLSRSAKHLYDLKLPNLNTFASWSAYMKQSRKEHARIVALYPHDAEQRIIPLVRENL